MRLKLPVVAVLGYKDSGKTAVVEGIVKELTKRGYQVATAKHVNLKGFSMDIKGKDTWRHSSAGANPVVSVSDLETAILIKNGEENFSLDKLSKFVSEADTIVLEGFSQLVLNDEHVGKIFCIRNRQEYETYRQKARGEVIAFCCRQPLGRPILRIKEDFKVLVRRALKFVEREQRIAEILSSLAGLDCKKCGYESCEELAVAIYSGKAKLSDCIPLELRSKLKTRIMINDNEVPIQPFVSKIIRNSILGMVSSLKGVSIKGDELVHVRISS